MSGNARGFNRLMLADLGDNDAVVCIIDNARIQNFSSDYLSSKDKKVVLQFKEYGDKDYVLNATSYTALSERYGDGVSDAFVSWKGKPCVLVKQETTDLSGNPMLSVWVARRAVWDAAVKELAAAESPRRPKRR